MEKPQIAPAFSTVIYMIYAGMAGIDIINLKIQEDAIKDYISTITTLHFHAQHINTITDMFYATNPEEQNVIIRGANIALLRKRSATYTLLGEKLRQAQDQIYSESKQE